MAGLLTPALREIRSRVMSTNPQSPAYWLERMFGGRTATGRRIDLEEANQFSAFFDATRIAAEDIGTLPLPIYRTIGGGRGKEEARDHPAWKLLNKQANPEMSSDDFRGALQGQASARGNGFAEIEWDQVMRPRALWPLRSDRMRLSRNGVDVSIDGAPAGQLVYRYTLPNGQEKTFAPENILHLRGYSPDGLWGYSVVRLAREGIAIELAAQEYLARFFGNGAEPGIVLQVPRETKLSDTALENLRTSWNESHQGLSNSHRTAILESGITANAVGMSHDDAQFMATRQFSVTEVARWFRMPPHLLADLERSTNNNIEHQGLEYITYTIRAWVRRWEGALYRSGVVTDPYWAEHRVDAFARGDMKTRAEFYHSLRQDGAITGRRIMELENMDTSDLPPAADELWVPTNNVSLASSLDDKGRTMQAKVADIGVLTRAGFEADTAVEAIATGDLTKLKHTGLVPITVQVDPSTLPQGGAQA